MEKNDESPFFIYKFKLLPLGEGWGSSSVRQLVSPSLSAQYSMPDPPELPKNSDVAGNDFFRI
jgi:hypothetical protein